MTTKQRTDYKTLPFYKCPKKFEDRRASIIDVYRDIFQRESIPDDKQYWCVCAQQCDRDNPQVEPGSECMQMINSGLIKKHQWFGVDSEEDLIDLNKGVYSDLIWVKGELRKVIAQYWKNNNFNPAIINCDLLTMKKKSCTLITSILTMLVERNISNCMIILNSVLATRYRREWEEYPDKEIQNHVDFLSKDFDFANAFLNNNWELYPFGYYYGGTEKSTATMGSIVLFKKG